MCRGLCKSGGIEAYKGSWRDQFFHWFGDAGVFDIDDLRSLRAMMWPSATG
jgi:hypothetical protein